MTSPVVGAEAVNRKLSQLATANIAIARAAVAAGMKVARTAGVKASPGRVKLEWGSAIETGESSVTGRIGLGVKGYRKKVKRPHGVYLERGTEYIVARRFIATAIQTAKPKIVAAMQKAAQRKFAALANSQ